MLAQPSVNYSRCASLSAAIKGNAGNVSWSHVAECMLLYQSNLICFLAKSLIHQRIPHWDA